MIDPHHPSLVITIRDRETGETSVVEVDLVWLAFVVAGLAVVLGVAASG